MYYPSAHPSRLYDRKELANDVGGEDAAELCVGVLEASQLVSGRIPVYVFAFWLRSSVVSVLFSLISETSLRTQSRLFLFLKPVCSSLGLPTVADTVPQLLHYLLVRRDFFIESSGLPVA
ncbi:hypothetical protein J1614_003068 [Plenodomus biglobosus]|nr:hypothetical protein J1614_003068 [Plenodomus biglobosus]